MNKYKNWSPTRLDPRGRAIRKGAHLLEWCVLMCIPESGGSLVDQVNWDYCEEHLDENDIEIVSLRHWTKPLKVMLVKPGGHTEEKASYFYTAMINGDMLDSDRVCDLLMEQEDEESTEEFSV